MNSTERIEHLIDNGTWHPLDETVSPCDPLEFRDQKNYTERLKEAQERTGLQDGVQTGTGLLDGIPVALGVMDFNFMGGSMGSVVGEKITRLIEYATNEGLPLILVCASGGARMQEGILSLMQMAKISAALHVHQNCAKLLYIAVLTSPTTGGVTASFAMLGDLIFAEPKALIGFAGRRVIEQTLQEQLPDDFQTAEYVLHHGLLDLIVPRSFLKQALSETITLYKEAPFKVCGYIPYGQRGPLTKAREEQLRRFAHSSQDTRYTSFLNEFEDLITVFGKYSGRNLIQEDLLIKKAIELASDKNSQTCWLNPSTDEFQVRSKFGKARA
jgi:acetyl-CoA carboxylase carboxyl transferase subunit beta